ncbi:MAG: hypothetical protein HZC01_05265 [Candidatus Kerfeldbacteria bacterium]|nr:hypothetical protein [Candidatus Kerfeldbacteria bacterium]
MHIVSLLKRLVSRRDPFLSRDRVSVLLIAAGLAFNVGQWIYLALVVSPYEEVMYLHYNIYFGVDLVGQWYRIFLMPAIGTGIMILNIIFARQLHKKSFILSRLQLSFSLACQVLLVVASYLIMRQNTL